jgi:signal transduction histidine kinase/tetratricopeptide (TPR) repeat protein
MAFFIKLRLLVRYLTHIIAFLVGLNAFAVTAEDQRDSLKKALHVLQTKGSPRTKAELLIKLADAEKQTDYKQARFYVDDALALALLLKDHSLEAKSYHIIAEIEDEQSKFDSAIYYYQLAIRSFNHGADKLELATTLNQRGIVFENKGDYTNAYQDYLNSLKIYEELKDIKGISNEYLNLGLIHQYRKEFGESEKLFLKSLSLSRSINDESGIASALNNLGMNYQSQKKYGTALLYFKQVLAIDLKDGDENNIASSLNNVGTVSADMGKHKEALEYYSRSASIKKKLNDYIGLSNTYNNIASSLIKLNKGDEAEQYLDLSKGLSDQYGFKNNIVETYNIYYELALSRKDYRKALDYYVLQQKNIDSIEKEESELAIHRLQGQYQLDKANTEIALKSTELEGEQQLKLLYIIIILLLVAVSIYLYFNSKRIRQLYKVLNIQHKDIIDAKEKAEEATRIKSQFLSVMSHEIRTPLNAIIGVANLLADDIRNEEQQENIKVMHVASENLMHLINDLLDLSKLEVGKMQLDLGNIRLKRMCENVREMFAVLAAQKGIFLKLEFDESIPEVLTGDDIKVNQAITNLVGNAIKFTQNGSVSLTVKLISNTKESSMILFSVADTGIGIPADKQQSIFDSFIQASSDTNKKFGGTGLGLSISKKLVEVMGGGLTVSSEEGKGSVFSFQLEFARERARASREYKQVLHRAGLFKGRHILVADDNPVNVFVLKQFLHKWGATTSDATDGNQAISLLYSNNFDLILMDIQMPAKDGLEATREIRRSGEKWSNIPIIAITASHEDEVKISIHESGMDDFVIKPFLPDDLVNKISRFI